MISSGMSDIFMMRFVSRLSCLLLRCNSTVDACPRYVLPRDDVVGWSHLDLRALVLLEGGPAVFVLDLVFLALGWQG